MKTQPATAQAANTMKAIRLHEFGGPEVLRYEDAPMPELKSGEVLVRVHAVGVNPPDWYLADGYKMLPPEFQPPVPLPVIPGSDVSGVVESIAEDVQGFSVGNEVFGMIRFPSYGESAAYAEYVAAPASDLALKPVGIDHVHAAGAPMSGLTAWQFLIELGHNEPNPLQPEPHRPVALGGKTVLVNGAAGGVGHFAVQLAKWKGARVIAVASGAHESFLRELGADEFIDYTKSIPENIARNVDLVIDTLGGPTTGRFLRTLKRGGTLFPVFPGFSDAEEAANLGVTVSMTQVRSNGAQLAELGRLLDDGSIRVAIDSTFPLAEAQKAHERAASGHIRGKIVLTVADSRSQNLRGTSRELAQAGETFDKTTVQNFDEPGVSDEKSSVGALPFTARKPITLFLLLLLLLFGAASSAVAQSSSAVPVQLYTLDCGLTEFKDAAAFSDTGEYEGRSVALPTPCYLIHHGKEWMLWDTGNGDELAALPNGKVEFGGRFSQRLTLAGQLAQLGLKPDDIRFVALSHLHRDHTGNIRLFPKATFLVAASELAWARGKPTPFGVVPALIEPLAQARVEASDEDRDVFGDKTVQILKAPGHTPGSRMLLIKLAKSGTVFVSGDLYHTRENYEKDLVPSSNVSRADTMASFQRYKRIAANTNARVIIQHSPEDFAAMPTFPKYLD